MKMTRSGGARRRGYVLIMVLVVLLVLTLLVAGLYSASEDSRFTSQVMLGQRVAAARADEAVQRAVATLRAGTFTTNDLVALPYCTTPITHLRTAGTCGSGAFLTSGQMSGPTDGDLENGAGLLYQWWIYHQSNPDGTAPPNSFEIFNIYAEGYFGYATTRENFSVAAIAAEVTLPGSTTGPPNFDGDYGVIH